MHPFKRPSSRKGSRPRSPAPTTEKLIYVRYEKLQGVQQQTSPILYSSAITHTASTTEVAIATDAIPKKDKVGTTNDKWSTSTTTEKISQRVNYGSIPEKIDNRGIGTENICMWNKDQSIRDKSENRGITTEAISKQDRIEKHPDKTDKAAKTSYIQVKEIGTRQSKRDAGCFPVKTILTYEIGKVNTEEPKHKKSEAVGRKDRDASADRAEVSTDASYLSTIGEIVSSSDPMERFLSATEIEFADEIVRTDELYPKKQM